MDVQKLDEVPEGITASNEYSHGQSSAVISQDFKRLVTTDEAGISVTEGSYGLELLPSASSVDLPAYYDLDRKYKTSRSEIWSYYLYLVANSGATLSNFAPTAFQNLLSQAAGDAGVLPFAGR